MKIEFHDHQNERTSCQNESVETYIHSSDQSLALFYCHGKSSVSIFLCTTAKHSSKQTHCHIHISYATFFPQHSMAKLTRQIYKKPAGYTVRTRDSVSRSNPRPSLPFPHKNSHHNKPENKIIKKSRMYISRFTLPATPIGKNPYGRGKLAGHSWARESLDASFSSSWSLWRPRVRQPRCRRAPRPCGKRAPRCII